MTRGLLKKMALVAVLCLFIIQFFQPARNTSPGKSSNDLSVTTEIPDSVKIILKSACYDCHSNNTNYPWYAGVQPIGWLLSNHIREGKAELNFNEFSGYSARRQSSKLVGIANSIRNDIMPLPSYRWMHKEARLSQNQKDRVIHWARRSADSLNVN
jgi:hypothetical protein